MRIYTQPATDLLTTRICVRFLLGLILSGLSVSASAHLLNMSKARVALEPARIVSVELELDLLRTVGNRATYYELSLRPEPMMDPEIQTTLASLPNAINVVIGEHTVSLRLIDVQFPVASEREYLDPLSWPRTRVILTGKFPEALVASADTQLQVRFTDVFFFEEPIATTVIDTQTGVNQTRWIVTGQQSPVFDAAPWLNKQPAGESQRAVLLPQLWHYLVAGVRHILPGGLDHLLFVAGLFLLAQSLRQLLITVSVFTLAHSATLIFGALGWVQISPWIVEPVILASIAWVGVINIRGGPVNHGNRRLVFCFGLLHGLGFAGALRELKLPAEQTLSALVAFNVGVEVGQIAFLLSLVVLCVAMARLSYRQAPIRPLPIVERTRRIGGWVLVAAPVLLAGRYLL